MQESDLSTQFDLLPWLGWLVAAAALLANYLQWRASHIQAERGFKLTEQAEARREWNATIEPLLVLLDELEEDLYPMREKELPPIEVKKVCRLMTDSQAVQFQEAIQAYYEVCESADTDARTNTITPGIFRDYTADGRRQVLAAMDGLRKILARR